MWKKINLPFITERFVSVSAPVDHHVVAVDFDNIYLIDVHRQEIELVINDSSEVNILLDKIEKDSIRKIMFKGVFYNFFGLFGGKSVINFKNEMINVSEKQGNLVQVTIAGGPESFSYSFRDISGDWLFTSFSDDGSYFFIFEPYDIHLFARRR